HILFEDYRDAWKELVKEIEKYDIPLLIEGGVLHAKTSYDRKTRIGGIGLWEFRDPTATVASQLTEEERKTYGITEKATPIALIHPKIIWSGIFIDSVVMSTGQVNTSTIFSNIAYFLFSTFNKDANFSSATFNKDANFRSATFNKD